MDIQGKYYNYINRCIIFHSYTSHKLLCQEYSSLTLHSHTLVTNTSVNPCSDVTHMCDRICENPACRELCAMYLQAILLAQSHKIMKSIFLQCFAIKGCKIICNSNGICSSISASSSHTKMEPWYLKAFKTIVIAFTARANTSSLLTKPVAEGLVLTA